MYWQELRPLSVPNDFKKYMSRCMGKPTTWTDVIICLINDVINWRDKILTCSMLMVHVYFCGLQFAYFSTDFNHVGVKIMEICFSTKEVIVVMVYHSYTYSTK